MKENPMIMTLILFMSGVNLVASAVEATLPGYVLPNPKGGQAALGIVTSCSGVAMIIYLFSNYFLVQIRVQVLHL